MKIHAFEHLGKLRLPSTVAVILTLAACVQSDKNVQTTPVPAKPVTPASNQPAGNLGTTPVVNGGTQTPPADTAPINGSTGAVPGSAGSGDQVVINAARDTGAAAAGGTTTAGGSVIVGGKHAPYTAAPAGYSVTNVTQWVTAHQAAKGQGYKYVYIPADQIADNDMVNTLRVAAAKAWNHLSLQPDLDIPEDISGGAGLAFALNATKVWGQDAETNWGYIANCTPKSNIDISPAQGADSGACKTFSATDPVAIPNFVFNAVNGGPYANVFQTPPDFDSFQQKFQLGPLKYVATQHEAIVCGPRISAYRTVTLNGVPTIYSFTSDEFSGRDEGNINYTNAPTDDDQRQTGAFNAGPNDGNTAIASEWWMQLPNGFMYWGIHGEGSQERGKAEFPFAIDPANWTQNNDLAVARSCITCHAAGIQSAKNDADVAGKSGWPSNEELQAFYKPIRDKFQNAMKTLVTNLSDGKDDLNTHMVDGTVEPIAKAIMLIEGRYQPGNNDCSGFCNGKYGPQRQNLCETLPAR